MKGRSFMACCGSPASTMEGVVVYDRGTRRPEGGMPRASMMRNQALEEKRERLEACVCRAESSWMFGVARSVRWLG